MQFMKIGILTFHNAHNYGAVMQAYALRTKLRKMGQDAVILNYRNSTIENSYLPWRKCRYEQADWSLQCDKFNAFIDTILLEGCVLNVKFEDLKKLSVDCFICGSDQIWNSWLTGGLDRAYFLDFETNAKKISYAASKYTSEIAEKERNYFSKNLSDFSAVSVRENSLAEDLHKKCQIDAVTVLDPVFLLDAQDYTPLEVSVKEKHKFVLAYYLCEDTMLDQCARKVAKSMRLPLIEIHFYRLKDRQRYQIADCGPGEFLTYFHRAEYVLTNSYHGVLFSILFRRPFYAVYKEDSRKDAILKKLGLKERHVYSEEEIACGRLECRFEAALAALERERDASIAFLERSLELKCQATE